MNDPVAEIRDVVRSITEPYAASEIVANVDKYFTEDAFIQHPLLNQPKMADGRENLKGIYKMLRVMSINNKIEFHAVMWSEDKTQAALELTEYLQPRLFPVVTVPIRFIIRIDLRQEKDGKWRIYRQNDNLPSDLGMSGLWVPGLTFVSNTYKAGVGLASGLLGRFLLARGWMGA